MPFIGKCRFKHGKKGSKGFNIGSKIEKGNVIIFRKFPKGMGSNIRNISDDIDYFKCKFDIYVTQDDYRLLYLPEITLEEYCTGSEFFEIEYEYDTHVRNILHSKNTNKVKCIAVIKIYYHKRTSRYRAVLKEIKIEFRYELLCEWRDIMKRRKELKI